MKKSEKFIRLTVAVTVAAALFTGVANARETVRGKVLDAGTREAVAGANISTSSDDKTVGISDAEGQFSFNADEFPLTVRVEYLGYRAQEAVIREAGEPLTVYLTEDENLLTEVVVIGYGVQRRNELTGAVATVGKSHLDYNIAPSIDALLGGAIAGVSVTQSSGQPGASSNIRIRGGNSIHASNDPLYVIDGVIVYPRSTDAGAGSSEVAVESAINPLAALNPADIETVSILKDVSATAIFGSRGANGVIIVNTKKGNRDRDNITYSASIACSAPAKRLNLMNAAQWANIQRTYFGNKGNITDGQLAAIGNGYDWQDAVLQTGFAQKHDISVSGGDSRTKYLISGNYTDQSGIIINSGFDRYNFRINIDREIDNGLTVGTTATFGKSRQNSLTTSKEVNYNSSPFGDGITNSLTYALFMPPTVPVYTSDGSFNYTNPWESSHFSLNGRQANPVSDLKNSVAESINNSLLANFYARYSIAKGLFVKSTLSLDKSAVTQNFFAPSTSALGLNEVGVGSVGNKQHEIWQADATADYSAHLSDIHFINILGGYTFQNVQENYLINRSSHFTNESLKHNNLGDGSVQSPTINGILASRLNSIIARLNYSLLAKYHLTATFRADYSNRFAPGKRWGYFPSLGFAWNLNENIKFRLSGGTVGNTEISDYLYSQIFKTARYNGQTVYYMDNLGNPNLTWETTVQYNAGIDADFFDNRLNLTFDAYYKNTRDLLLEQPAPLGSGVDRQMVNVGNVTNKGVELGVNTILISGKKINLTLGANIAANINTITDLGGDNNILSGYYSEQILKTGEAFGSFYGLIFDGVVQADEDIATLPKVGGSTPQAGDAKFVDRNKDGNIDLNDRTILGSIQPAFTYGLSSSLACGRWDAFASFQGSQGNEVVNSLRRNLERPSSSYNLSAALLDAWTPTNPSNSVPRVSQGYQLKYIDSRHVEDASYFRLKNITAGYTFQINSLRSIRIFVYAQNLFTLAKYKGYDPEVASGLDTGAYPTARTFSIGINLKY